MKDDSTHFEFFAASERKPVGNILVVFVTILHIPYYKPCVFLAVTVLFNFLLFLFHTERSIFCDHNVLEQFVHLMNPIKDWVEASLVDIHMESWLY